MSMTARYKTEIKIPQPQLAQLRANVRGVACMEIMRLALEKIARERQGALAEGYADCNGKLHPCLTGIKTPRFSRGIGISIAADRRVRFEFDRQGANIAEAEAICRDVARAYAVIAIMRVQQQHGYRVSVEQETPADSGRSVRILAVKV
jgi:hypothetical protein